ncbi:MAG: hypothetical protein GX133_07395, partial [Syntrophomonadaceae bacterium]|nr:hypothetical protein [Syntrophomonadaceae bacterium]
VFGFALLTAAYLQVNGAYSEARWALGAALLLPLALIRFGRPKMRRRRKTPPTHTFLRQGR